MRDALLLAITVALTFVGLCVSCDVDPSRYYEALESAGFTEVQLTGFEWFACSDGEYVSGFKAKNPHGTRVSGVVCCGFSKRCTVRF